MQRKKLVIDLRWVRNNNLDGISRYAIEVAEGVLDLNQKEGEPFEVVLLFDKPELRDLVTNIIKQYTEAPVEAFMVPFPVLDIREIFQLPRLLKSIDTDIFFATNYLTFPFNKRFKTITVVHDLTQYVSPETLESNIKWKIFFKFKFQTQFILKNTDLIVADSNHTKEDIKRIFKTNDEKIKVIYPGIDGKFFDQVPPTDIRAVRKKYNLPKKFILSVSRQEPRKNLSNLIRAYHSLPEKVKRNYSLVLAGSKHPKFFPLLESLVSDLGVENVLFPGYVDENDLAALYQSASLVVYPSLYEGFGLPVIEAMASGVPVVASNISSMPEVADGGAFLIDPYNLNNITGSMVKVLSDDTLKKELVEKGVKKAERFTWSQTCSDLFESFKKLSEL